MKHFGRILLMPIFAKAYNKMLLKCIYEPIDKILRP